MKQPAFLFLAACAVLTPRASGDPAQIAKNTDDAKRVVHTAWPFDEKEALKRQQETASSWNQPIDDTNSIGMKLRLIPAGEFMMGSPEEDPDHQKDEGPVHRVRITKPYYMGVNEVTIGQFRRFVDATKYRTDAEKDGRGGWGYTGNDNQPFKRDPKYTWKETGFEQSDDHPVVNVSWNDAVAFCGWLGKTEKQTYRLPTEAEWEYACRAGTATRFYHGDDVAGIAQIGNVADAAMTGKFAEWMKVSKIDREKMGSAGHQDGYIFTSPVGKFLPNAFGFYDMVGNVWEWCADWDDTNYYGISPVDDPPGPESGKARIRRGGSWLHSPAFGRSAQRRRYAPDARNSPIGFRVVQSMPEMVAKVSKSSAHAETQTGSFKFTHLGREIKVFTALPAESGNGLLVLFHGTRRNAADYLKSGTVLAEKLGMALIVPEFDNERFPAEAYHYGGVYRDGKLLPADERTFSYISPMIHEAEKWLGRTNVPCWLVGHSAGAQFLDRMVGISPEPVRRMVVVNPGSLLFPTRDQPWPYGFGGLPHDLSNDAALKRYLAQPMTLYVGTGDTGTNELPTGKEAYKQGNTRIERSRNCFALGKKLAEKKGWAFGWTMVEAEGLDHQSLPMWQHANAKEAFFGNKPSGKD